MGGTSGIPGFRPERLAEKRKRSGMTQREAAKKMHLSISGYSNFENGVRVPSWQTIHIMALTFKTSVEYLTGKTDDPAPTHLLMPVDDGPETSDLVVGYLELSDEEKGAVRTIVKGLRKEQ